MHYNLETFTEFLKGINLEDYKNRFSQIKTVEMDLPKNIQALDIIYEQYWDNNTDMYNNTPITFDDFYAIYYKSKEKNIRDFWNKSGFGLECDCFPRGLKARIYRTWASLVTQIHAGYVAESVFGDGMIEQNSDLDHKGIDILIHYKGCNIGIQIKKESKRPEIDRMYNFSDRSHKGGKKEFKNLDIIDIWYVVPNPNDYNSPYYKNKNRKGELRDSVKSFIKFNNNNGTLDRLENGFVIFTPREFEIIKSLMDN